MILDALIGGAACVTPSRACGGSTLVCARHPLPCLSRSDRSHHDRNGRCVSWCASDSSLLTFVGSALCLGLRVSSLSSNCIGVASGSDTEIGGASTADLAALGFGHNGAPSVCSVAQRGNQYTPPVEERHSNVVSGNQTIVLSLRICFR